ncbi:MAG: hypothetical protein AAGJ94_13465 [Pseudomonadota bacterium]
MRHPLRTGIILIGVFAATSSAATVFVMKKAAERDARAIGELNRKISAEKQRISELEAEWSALDHPARLQVLVDRHNDVLGLEPIRAEQITPVSVVASAARRKVEDGEEESQ